MAVGTSDGSTEGKSDASGVGSMEGSMDGLPDWSSLLPRSTAKSTRPPVGNPEGMNEALEAEGARGLRLEPPGRTGLALRLLRLVLELTGVALRLVGSARALVRDGAGDALALGGAVAEVAGGARGRHEVRGAGKSWRAGLAGHVAGQGKGATVAHRAFRGAYAVVRGGSIGTGDALGSSALRLVAPGGAWLAV
eukprot:scaffold2527_cov241-Pinguiococcus_pyrenoidosus.AAC.7